ncbi:hypothetical protein CNR22_07715 [Sphingobacteriaceae bacterium]|nr:hypothetical protein CNR22_07715 [Sphingobacteriaceae bacterium]
MSNFTYEIDERNLRLKMKEFTVPVKEEAWQKFESFSEATGNQNRENRLKNFNFSLNRSVVLPSVFGVIIILFSFLLVNFVSIKNPSRVNEQKVEIKPVVASTPEPVVTSKVETLGPVPVAEVKAEPAPVIETKVEEKVAATPEVKTEQTIVAPTKVETTTDVVSDEEKARLKAERRAARAAERQKLKEISPTPISEEGDSEVRPD